MPNVIGTHIFNDGNWHLILDFGNKYTLRNPSSNPVGVYFSDLDSEPQNIEPSYILQIGGFYDKIVTPNDKYVWFKALDKLPASIKFIQEGYLDPDEDFSSISSVLINLINNFDAHLTANNPHGITKDDVELNNIPNEISSDTSSDSNEILATTKLVKKNYTDLLKLITDHKNDFNNPHDVTKSQIGLSEVENIKIDLSPDLLITTSLPPHILLDCPTKELENGWLYKDIDVLPDIFKIENDIISILNNFKVTYIYKSKIYISRDFNNDSFNCTIPSNDNIYYLYVDITNMGIIYNFGITNNKPTAHTFMNKGFGDWLNLSTFKMYDINNEELTRVYIGSVERENNIIKEPVSIPIGDKYISPVKYSNINLGDSIKIINPFIYDVNVLSEINYNDKWNQTYWNDQIGVLASIEKNDNRYITIQSGYMGFMVEGRQSGNGFGSIFPTLTTPPPRMRVQITRVF